MKASVYNLACTTAMLALSLQGVFNFVGMKW
jgi:hypothetical protein